MTTEVMTSGNGLYRQRLRWKGGATGNLAGCGSIAPCWFRLLGGAFALRAVGGVLLRIAPTLRSTSSAPRQSNPPPLSTRGVDPVRSSDRRRRPPRRRPPAATQSSTPPASRAPCEHRAGRTPVRRGTPSRPAPRSTRRTSCATYPPVPRRLLAAYLAHPHRQGGGERRQVSVLTGKHRFEGPPAAGPADTPVVEPRPRQLPRREHSVLTPPTPHPVGVVHHRSDLT